MWTMSNSLRNELVRLYSILVYFYFHLGLGARKPVFGRLQITQAQTSLISAFVIRILSSIIFKLAVGEISIF